MNDETGNNTRGNHTQFITTFSTPQSVEQRKINNTFRYVGHGGYRCASWNVKFLGVAAFYWEYEEY
jgi:hypothetical protein